jgi:hypothetical protein
MRSPAVYEETGKGLTYTRDDKKYRRQRTDLRIGDRVLAHEPWEQRRKHQMKEMRRAMGKSDK